MPLRNGDAARVLDVANVLHGRGAIADGWELVLVDDNVSADTLASIRSGAGSDPRVHIIRRVGRNGLMQTCLAAMLANGAPLVAMIEAEAARDVDLIPAMIEALQSGEADVVVAARTRSAGGWLRGKVRTALGAMTRGVLSTQASDPASGFFVMRRDALEALTPQLSSLSHHVLLDLIATARGSLRIRELAGASERAGRSELKLAIELAALTLGKFTGDAVSIRFILFCLVGLSGVVVHLALLDIGLLVSPRFVAAQTAATIGAMIWNFSLNNIITYGDQRLTGWAYVTGLIRFMVICGIGAVSNVGVATFIYAQDSRWWIAGLGGAVMGAVWNYAVSAVFVWRPR